MMFQIFSIMQSINCVYKGITHRWMRTSVDSLHLIDKQTCSGFFWWGLPCWVSAAAQAVLTSDEQGPL